MGIESVFACNAQNNKELEARGEKRFRMLWQPMMSGVSHAQRLPRQRLSANRRVAQQSFHIVVEEVTLPLRRARSVGQEPSLKR